MPCSMVRTFPALSIVLAIALVRSNGASALLIGTAAEHDLVVALAVFGLADQHGRLRLVGVVLGHLPADRVLQPAVGFDLGPVAPVGVSVGVKTAFSGRFRIQKVERETGS